MWPPTRVLITAKVTRTRARFKIRRMGLGNPCHGANVKGWATGKERGWTSLHYATNSGHPELVDAFVKAGADVNARDADRDTPMHAAAYLGDISIVKALLAAGAELDPVNNDGKTPLDSARSPAMRRFLEKQGAKSGRKQ